MVPNFIMWGRKLSSWFTEGWWFYQGIRLGFPPPLTLGKLLNDNDCCCYTPSNKCLLRNVWSMMKHDILIKLYVTVIYFSIHTLYLVFIECPARTFQSPKNKILTKHSLTSNMLTHIYCIANVQNTSNFYLSDVQKLLCGKSYKRIVTM